jgi:hypothetical protein
VSDLLRAPFPWFGVPQNVAAKIRVGNDWSDLGPCWEWTAATTNGYGVVQHDGRVQRAHRVVWVCLRGPLDEDLELDHLCRNRPCVKPAHLDPVTGVVNNARSESASAKHARQTHCLRGHGFTPENTYLRARDHKTERFCRECARERDRKRYAVKRLAIGDNQ